MDRMGPGVSEHLYKEREWDKKQNDGSSSIGFVRPCGSEIIFTTAFKANEKIPLAVDIPGEARALY